MMVHLIQESAFAAGEEEGNSFLSSGCLGCISVVEPSRFVTSSTIITGHREN
jgi:hypothetical protein